MKTKRFFSRQLVVCLLGAVLFIAACDGLVGDDFLDRYPLDTPNPDIYFVDEGSAKAAVTAAYYPWARGSISMIRRDFVTMQDAMSDDGYWRPAIANAIQQARWNITSDHPYMNNYWTAVYRSVNAANYAIHGIPRLLERGLTQEQIDPYIAEARFIRGFSYLYLVTFFGEVPLIDAPLSSFEEFEQPRAPVEQIYTQIVDDFRFATDNLPPQWQSAYTGSATKAAAAAYLAKAYLYMEDYPAAETAARQAIEIAEGSGYRLLEDYASIFEITNEANPEVLFYFSFIDNHPSQGSNDIINRIPRLVPPEFVHVYGVAGRGYHLAQRDLYDAFEEGDPRRAVSMFAPGDPYGVYEGDEPFTYTHTTYDENGGEVQFDRTYVAGDTILYDVSWSETGMNARKGIYNLAHLADVRWAGTDVPMMRMADLYLILAEALAEQGDAEALTWVNHVRARPSVDLPPKSGSNLIELVRHERRVELALEGQRLADLVRWREVKNTFGDGRQVKRHFFSDYLPDEHADRFDSPVLDNYPGDLVLFPIPQDEIDQNENINSNNPGF